MQMSSAMDTESGMIVKRVSVPIGLEELMEGLTKEVLLKKPKDLYVFAAEYFSHLLILRQKGSYKAKSFRTVQSAAKHIPKENIEKFMKESIKTYSGSSKELYKRQDIRSGSQLRGNAAVLNVHPNKKQENKKTDVTPKKTIRSSRKGNVSVEKDMSPRLISVNNDKSGKTSLSRNRSLSNKRDASTESIKNKRSTPRGNLISKSKSKEHGEKIKQTNKIQSDIPKTIKSEQEITDSKNNNKNKKEHIDKENYIKSTINQKDSMKQSDVIGNEALIAPSESPKKENLINKILTPQVATGIATVLSGTNEEGKIIITSDKPKTIEEDLKKESYLHNNQDIGKKSNWKPKLSGTEDEDEGNKEDKSHDESNIIKNNNEGEDNTNIPHYEKSDILIDESKENENGSNINNSEIRENGKQNLEQEINKTLENQNKTEASINILKQSDISLDKNNEKQCKVKDDNISESNENEKQKEDTNETTMDIVHKSETPLDNNNKSRENEKQNSKEVANETLLDQNKTETSIDTLQGNAEAFDKNKENLKEDENDSKVKEDISLESNKNEIHNLEQETNDNLQDLNKIDTSIDILQGRDTPLDKNKENLNGTKEDENDNKVKEDDVSKSNESKKQNLEKDTNETFQDQNKTETSIDILHGSEIPLDKNKENLNGTKGDGNDNKVKEDDISKSKGSEKQNLEKDTNETSQDQNNVDTSIDILQGRHTPLDKNKENLYETKNDENDNKVKEDDIWKSNESEKQNLEKDMNEPVQDQNKTETSIDILHGSETPLDKNKENLNGTKEDENDNKVKEDDISKSNENEKQNLEEDANESLQDQNKTDTSIDILQRRDTQLDKNKENLSETKEDENDNKVKKDDISKSNKTDTSIDILQGRDTPLDKNKENLNGTKEDENDNKVKEEDISKSNESEKQNLEKDANETETSIDILHGRETPLDKNKENLNGTKGDGNDNKVKEDDISKSNENEKQNLEDVNESLQDQNKTDTSIDILQGRETSLNKNKENLSETERDENDNKVKEDDISKSNQSEKQNLEKDTNETLQDQNQTDTSIDILQGRDTPLHKNKENLSETKNTPLNKNKENLSETEGDENDNKVKEDDVSKSNESERPNLEKDTNETLQDQNKTETSIDNLHGNGTPLDKTKENLNKTEDDNDKVKEDTISESSENEKQNLEENANKTLQYLNQTVDILHGNETPLDKNKENFNEAKEDENDNKFKEDNILEGNENVKQNLEEDENESLQDQNKTDTSIDILQGRDTPLDKNKENLNGTKEDENDNKFKEDNIPEGNENVKQNLEEDENETLQNQNKTEKSIDVLHGDKKGEKESNINVKNIEKNNTEILNETKENETEYDEKITDHKEIEYQNGAQPEDVASNFTENVLNNEHVGTSIEKDLQNILENNENKANKNEDGIVFNKDIEQNENKDIGKNEIKNTYDESEKEQQNILEPEKEHDIINKLLHDKGHVNKMSDENIEWHEDKMDNLVTTSSENAKEDNINEETKPQHINVDVQNITSKEDKSINDNDLDKNNVEDNEENESLETKENIKVGTHENFDSEKLKREIEEVYGETNNLKQDHKTDIDTNVEIKGKNIENVKKNNVEDNEDKSLETKENIEEMHENFDKNNINIELHENKDKTDLDLEESTNMKSIKLNDKEKTLNKNTEEGDKGKRETENTHVSDVEEHINEASSDKNIVNKENLHETNNENITNKDNQSIVGNILKEEGEIQKFEIPVNFDKNDISVESNENLIKFNDKESSENISSKNSADGSIKEEFTHISVIEENINKASNASLYANNIVDKENVMNSRDETTNENINKEEESVDDKKLKENDVDNSEDKKDDLELKNNQKANTVESDKKTDTTDIVLEKNTPTDHENSTITLTKNVEGGDYCKDETKPEETNETKEGDKLNENKMEIIKENHKVELSENVDENNITALNRESTETKHKIYETNIEDSKESDLKIQQSSNASEPTKDLKEDTKSENVFEENINKLNDVSDNVKNVTSEKQAFEHLNLSSEDNNVNGIELENIKDDNPKITEIETKNESDENFISNQTEGKYQKEDKTVVKDLNKEIQNNDVDTENHRKLDKSESEPENMFHKKNILNKLEDHLENNLNKVKEENEEEEHVPVQLKKEQTDLSKETENNLIKEEDKSMESTDDREKESKTELANLEANTNTSADKILVEGDHETKKIDENIRSGAPEESKLVKNIIDDKNQNMCDNKTNLDNSLKTENYENNTANTDTNILTKIEAKEEDENYVEESNAKKTKEIENNESQENNLKNEKVINTKTEDIMHILEKNNANSSVENVLNENEDNLILDKSEVNTKIRKEENMKDHVTDTNKDVYDSDANVPIKHEENNSNSDSKIHENVKQEQIDNDLNKEDGTPENNTKILLSETINKKESITDKIETTKAPHKDTDNNSEENTNQDKEPKHELNEEKFHKKSEKHITFDAVPTEISDNSNLKPNSPLEETSDDSIIDVIDKNIDHVEKEIDQLLNIAKASTKEEHNIADNAEQQYQQKNPKDLQTIDAPLNKGQTRSKRSVSAEASGLVKDIVKLKPQYSFDSEKLKREIEEAYGINIGEKNNLIDKETNVEVKNKNIENLKKEENSVDENLNIINKHLKNDILSFLNFEKLNVFQIGKPSTESTLISKNVNDKDEEKSNIVLGEEETKIEKNLVHPLENVEVKDTLDNTQNIISDADTNEKNEESNELEENKSTSNSFLNNEKENIFKNVVKSEIQSKINENEDELVTKIDVDKLNNPVILGKHDIKSAEHIKMDEESKVKEKENEINNEEGSNEKSNDFKNIENCIGLEEHKSAINLFLHNEKQNVFSSDNRSESQNQMETNTNNRSLIDVKIDEEKANEKEIMAKANISKLNVSKPEMESDKNSREGAKIEEAKLNEVVVNKNESSGQEKNENDSVENNKMDLQDDDKVEMDKSATEKHNEEIINKSGAEPDLSNETYTISAEDIKAKQSIINPNFDDQLKDSFDKDIIEDDSSVKSREDSKLEQSNVNEIMTEANVNKLSKSIVEDKNEEASIEYNNIEKKELNSQMENDKEVTVNDSGVNASITPKNNKGNTSLSDALSDEFIETNKIHEETNNKDTEIEEIIANKETEKIAEDKSKEAVLEKQNNDTGKINNVNNILTNHEIEESNNTEKCKIEEDSNNNEQSRKENDLTDLNILQKTDTQLEEKGTLDTAENKDLFKEKMMKLEDRIVAVNSFLNFEKQNVFKNSDEQKIENNILKNLKDDGIIIDKYQKSIENLIEKSSITSNLKSVPSLEENSKKPNHEILENINDNKGENKTIKPLNEEIEKIEAISKEQQKSNIVKENIKKDKENKVHNAINTNNIEQNNEESESESKNNISQNDIPIHGSGKEIKDNEEKLPLESHINSSKDETDNIDHVEHSDGEISKTNALNTNLKSIDVVDEKIEMKDAYVNDINKNKHDLKDDDGKTNSANQNNELKEKDSYNMPNIINIQKSDITKFLQFEQNNVFLKGNDAISSNTSEEDNKEKPEPLSDKEKQLTFISKADKQKSVTPQDEKRRGSTQSKNTQGKPKIKTKSLSQDNISGEKPLTKTVDTKLKRIKSENVLQKPEYKSRIPTADRRNRQKIEKKANSKENISPRLKMGIVDLNKAAEDIKSSENKQEKIGGSKKISPRIKHSKSVPKIKSITSPKESDKVSNKTKLNNRSFSVNESQNKKDEKSVTTPKNDSTNKDIPDTTKTQNIDEIKNLEKEATKQVYDPLILKEELNKVHNESKLTSFKTSYNPYLLKQEIKNAAVDSTKKNNFMNEVVAAIKIQSMWRGFKTRKVNLNREKIKKQQNDVGDSLIKQDDHNLIADKTNIKNDKILNELKAAVRIQSLWRGFQVRKNKKDKIVDTNEESTKSTKNEVIKKNLLSEVSAAIIIQSCWKKYKRKHTKTMDDNNRKEKLVNENETNENKTKDSKISEFANAALLIQKAWRGFQVRKVKNQSRLFGSTVKSPEKQKEVLKSPSHKSKTSSALKIQSLWRGYQVRKNILKVNKKLDRTEDTTLSKNLTDEDILKAATKIQAGVRGYLQRKKLTKTSKLPSVNEELADENNTSKSAISLSDEEIIKALKALDQIEIPNDKTIKSQRLKRSVTVEEPICVQTKLKHLIKSGSEEKYTTLKDDNNNLEKVTPLEKEVKEALSNYSIAFDNLKSNENKSNENLTDLEKDVKRTVKNILDNGDNQQNNKRFNVTDLRKELENVYNSHGENDNKLEQNIIEPTVNQMPETSSNEKQTNKNKLTLNSPRDLSLDNTDEHTEVIINKQNDGNKLQSECNSNTDPNLISNGLYENAPTRPITSEAENDNKFEFSSANTENLQGDESSTLNQLNINDKDEYSTDDERPSIDSSDSADTVILNESFKNKNEAKSSATEKAADNNGEANDKPQVSLFDIAQLRKELQEAGLIHTGNNVSQEQDLSTSDKINNINAYEENNAATKIQRIFRGFKARKLFKSKLKEKYNVEHKNSNEDIISNVKEPSNIPQIHENNEISNLHNDSYIVEEPTSHETKSSDKEELNVIIKNDLNGLPPIVEEQDTPTNESEEIKFKKDGVQLLPSNQQVKFVHEGDFHDTVVIPLPMNSPSPTKRIVEIKDAQDTTDTKPGVRVEESTANESKIESNLNQVQNDVMQDVQNQATPAGSAVLTSPRPTNPLDNVVCAQMEGTRSVGSAHDSAKGDSAVETCTTATQSDKANSESRSVQGMESGKHPETEKNMEVQAATKIQAGFRGYQVRKQLKLKNGSSDINNYNRVVRRKSSGKNDSKVAALKAASQAKSKDTDLEEKSAVKIQAGVRGFLVRRRQKKQQNQHN